MVDFDHQLDQTSTPNTVFKPSRKKELLTTAMKRTTEWIFSQDIPTDITVQVGEASFSLHKFPLVTKCGYLRKLVSKSSDADLSSIQIPDIPGGAEAFELAAKFCYGLNFEISPENVAILRCAAEHLEMTEDYAAGNLVDRTEAYLAEVAFKSLAGTISVLHTSEDLLPVAEEVRLVSRCIDNIAAMVCKDSQFDDDDDDHMDGIGSTLGSQKNQVVDWWAEDLSVLRIDVFQRVIMAMVGRGFKEYALGPILMLYAQKSLRGLEVFGKGRKKMEPRQEHEKRVVLETIVSLLPSEKNAMSVSFLSMLLRASIHLDTTMACRLNLEKRMSLQLNQAVLDDLLIPSFSFHGIGDTLFDVDTVQRVMMNYLENEFEEKDEGHLFSSSSSYSPSDMERVGKLMENYLAEIATDRNLSVSKFIDLAELVPEKARVVEDGLYRGIDIFLKAHPDLSELERKKVCSIMDCQKLSREACAHAAKNDRLPVQTVVQVLYHEQQRFRESPAASHHPTTKPSINDHGRPVSDELSTLRRENQDLKLELAKMKMRLKEIEKRSAADNKAAVASPNAGKPPLPRKSLVSSVSRGLGKLNPFVIASSSSKSRNKPNKDRRHSIS